MSINAHVHSYLAKDYHTEALNTAIDEEIPGQNGKRLALVGFEYLNDTTIHNLCVMHCGSSAGSRNTASVLAVSGATQITTTTAPTSPKGDAIAADDIIAFQLTDGTWEFDTCASVAGSVIQCTNAIVGVDAGVGGTAIAAGGKVRIFGIIADGYHYNFHLPVSVTTKYEDTVLCTAPFMGDPLYVSDANATAAGFLKSLLFAYINK